MPLTPESDHRPLAKHDNARNNVAANRVLSPGSSLNSFELDGVRRLLKGNAFAFETRYAQSATSRIKHLWSGMRGEQCQCLACKNIPAIHRPIFEDAVIKKVNRNAV